MVMYIRVKRKKTTAFLLCDPSESVLEIKLKLEVLMDNPVHKQRLILLSNNFILEDQKTLADQGVENDDIVALTLMKENGEWEDIDITKLDYQSQYDPESS